MPGLLGKSFLFLIFTVSLYPIFILLLTIPWLQRHALYAHEIHSGGFWHNVNDPESFGFAKNQVIPFNLSTLDGETLYGWHILPLDIYASHQSSLLTHGSRTEKSSSSSDADDSLQTQALDLLKQDPEARVVINFHGNAGHVAQGWRTDTYRSLASQPHTHVFTIDYRGFGKSTGFPSEAGLITDGVALADYVLHDIGIDSGRVVVLGQSLGTAVATAVGLHFALPFEDPSTSAIPSPPHTETINYDLLPGPVTSRKHEEATLFAGIILVAPFTSLPSLLLSYRIGGLVPILAPLRPYPRITAWVTEYILDKWPTALRLAAYVRCFESGVGRHGTGTGGGGVQIIHAVNDKDISVEQGRMLFRDAVGAVDTFEGIGEVVWGGGDGGPAVRLEIVEHGGHNRVVTYAPVALAVMRAFKGE